MSERRSESTGYKTMTDREKIAQIIAPHMRLTSFNPDNETQELNKLYALEVADAILAALAALSEGEAVQGVVGEIDEKFQHLKLPLTHERIHTGEYWICSPNDSDHEHRGATEPIAEMSGWGEDLDACAEFFVMVANNWPTLRKSLSPIRESDKVQYLIWSGEHECYWRPDASGYTKRICEAGRYSLEDAKKRTSHCGPEKRIEIEPIAALSPIRGWRPIESAPKDGSVILVARYDETFGWVRGTAYWVDDLGGNWLSRGVSGPADGLGLAHPTHWKPFDPPPPPIDGGE